MSSIKAGNTELRHLRYFIAAHGIVRELGEAKRAIVELTELQGGQLRSGVLPSINVCLPPEFIRRFVQRHPRRQNGTSTSIIEMASVEDALSTVRQSGSAAILPDHAVCRERHGDLARISLRGFPSSNHKIAFLRPRNACRCHAAAAFIELARRIRYKCFPIESYRSN